VTGVLLLSLSVDLLINSVDSYSVLAHNLRLFSKNWWVASILYAPAGGVFVLFARTLSRLYLLMDLKEQDCLLFQGLFNFSSAVNFLNFGFRWKLQREPATKWLDCSFAPIPASHDRFARQNR